MTCLPMLRSWSLPALGILALAGGLACGGSSSSGPPAAGKKTVLVVSSPNTQFQPATVNITVGDTVAWAWTSGSTQHNIISYGANTFPNKGNAVGSTTNTDVFDFPASYQYVFTASGTYTYYCSTHGNTGGGGMAGSVVVSP